MIQFDAPTDATRTGADDEYGLDQWAMVDMAAGGGMQPDAGSPIVARGLGLDPDAGIGQQAGGGLRGYPQQARQGGLVEAGGGRLFNQRVRRLLTPKVAQPALQIGHIGQLPDPFRADPGDGGDRFRSDALFQGFMHHRQTIRRRDDQLVHQVFGGQRDQGGLKS